MVFVLASFLPVAFLLPPVLPPLQHVELALLSTSLMPMPVAASTIDAAINGANGHSSTVAAMLATGTCGLMLSSIMGIALDGAAGKTAADVP